MLADEMGVGKTIQALGIAYHYRKDWPLLIVCPASLKMNWRKEILQWFNNRIQPDDIHIVKMSKAPIPNTKVVILAYDICYKIERKLEEKNFNVVIADEAHFLKSTGAKRSFSLLPILKKSKRLIMLTGTPILARPIEAFNIINCVRPDLFDDFKVFGGRYCQTDEGTLLTR